MRSVGLPAVTVVYYCVTVTLLLYTGETNGVRITAVLDILSKVPIYRNIEVSIFHIERVLFIPWHPRILNESFDISNIDIVSIRFVVYQYRIELDSDLDTQHSGHKCKDRLVFILISQMSLYFRPMWYTSIYRTRCSSVVPLCPAM